MEFNPALPLPIKWNIGDDRFNEGQQVLSLTNPVDSVTHLIDHLQNLVNTKAKEGEDPEPVKGKKTMTGEKQEGVKINPKEAMPTPGPKIGALS